MSEADFAVLKSTGKLPPTRETFIGMTKASTSKNALKNIGIRSKNLANHPIYGDLPFKKGGWTWKHAFFKGEKDFVNIGLGKGKAMDIFNKNIIDSKKIPKK